MTRINSVFVYLALLFFCGSLLALQAPLTYLWLKNQKVDAETARVTNIKHEYSKYSEPGSKPGTIRFYWADTYEYEITYKNKSPTARYYPVLKSKIYYPNRNNTTVLSKLNLNLNDSITIMITENQKVLLPSLLDYRFNYYADLFWALIFTAISISSLILGYRTYPA